MRILMGFDSQEAFGATLGGFSVNRVSRAERGENPIPTEMLTALAEKGVNVNYILTGEGPMWARHIVRLSQRVSPDELREILAELEKHQEQTGAIPGATTPPTLEQIQEVDRRLKVLETARKKDKGGST